jgi:hypothetical protein
MIVGKSMFCTEYCQTKRLKDHPGKTLDTLHNITFLAVFSLLHSYYEWKQLINDQSALGAE